VTPDDREGRIALLLVILAIVIAVIILFLPP
jgi:hypothetical protein